MGRLTESGCGVKERFFGGGFLWECCLGVLPLDIFIFGVMEFSFIDEQMVFCLLIK